VAEGMPARAAAALLLAEAPAPRGEPPPQRESRFAINDRAFAVDSAALVTEADAGVILCTGSHGQLLGGKPETAIKHPVFAAFYNDAGIGIEEAGTSRLPALDARGIAGGVVSHRSARIGDGRSTHEDGVLSRVNATARRMGLRAGMTAREAVDLLSQLAPGPKP
ncbi:MAG: hypothetical protein K2X11_08610, partial [Acetobacteraceae bacterium]|nr:hypothetical protein [Acetobacteraceae bacterium]